MAWRIVKQPNGLLARFSDIVDDFTHMNMSEAEALEVCREYLGIVEAEKKVLAGVQDWKPWTNGVLGSGLDRWNESIKTIKSVHGKKAAEHRVHADAGDSAASSDVINASAESSSQTETKPAQRG